MIRNSDIKRFIDIAHFVIEFLLLDTDSIFSQSTQLFASSQLPKIIRVGIK